MSSEFEKIITQLQQQDYNQLVICKVIGMKVIKKIKYLQVSGPLKKDGLVPINDFSYEQTPIPQQGEEIKLIVVSNNFNNYILLSFRKAKN